MATAMPNQKPTPERIFGTLTAYEQTDALKAAIELEIFTKIGEGANEAASLAKSVGAAERGVRILCDYMVVHGFLTKEQNRYGLTQESAIFLDKRSPAYMGALSGFLTAEAHKRNFGALAKAVRKGGSATDHGDNSKPNDEFWVEFARSMAALAIPGAEFLAALTGASEQKPCKVLDIAAGHGMFGITIARRNPNAQIAALDWPAVLAVAEENAKKFGVTERYSVRPGSAFEVETGDGYDYVLVTNLLHHFDIPTCEKLMHKVHTALKPGGKALTLEFVPNEDRVSPPMAATFSLIMLANTDAGDAYTRSEYDKMMSNAGFARTTFQQVPDMPQTVVISEK